MLVLFFSNLPFSPQKVTFLPTKEVKSYHLGMLLGAELCPLKGLMLKS